MSIEVTQADRDASDTLEENMDGHWTEPMRVFVAKAFARHRIAAYEAGVLDGTMKAVREMQKDNSRPKTKEPLTCRGEASE